MKNKILKSFFAVLFVSLFIFSGNFSEAAEMVSINAKDITSTSVTLVTSGDLKAPEYTFYIFDGDTVESKPLDSITLSTSSKTSLESNFSGLTPNHRYVAILSFERGTEDEGTVYVNFKTLTVSNSPTSKTPTAYNPNNPTNKTPTDTKYKGIVPRCNVGEIDKITGQYQTPCNFTFFMELINNIIKFLLFTIATPLVALIIIYTAYLFLTAGGSAGKTEKAKHIFFSVVVGYVIALAAWLIINAILGALGIDSSINTFLK